VAKQKAKKSGGAQLPSWVFLAGAVALLAVAGIGIWVLLTPQTQGGIGPQLAVNQERIELGKQPFEKMVRAEFVVSNTGDRALTLDASAPVRALEGC
jgi:hypothetical protein